MIAGGGTGGHLFPGIALAEELRARDEETEILFVGTARGIEVRSVPRAGFNLELLPVYALRGKGPKEFIKNLCRLPWALVKAWQLVRRWQPDVAVSVGGYAAGPAVLVCRLMGIPTMVMEQNAIAGVTNRILGLFATRVIAALPVQGFAAHKVSVLGNPVRAELQRVRDAAFVPGIARGQAPRLLVFGGSQGARALNDAMIAAAPLLIGRGSGWRIVHQTGRTDYERVEHAYRVAGVRNIRVQAFIDDMATAYEEADLVLCRAGASTTAELTMCGRPAILVPFPAATDDHQTANAVVVAESGGFVHLPQSQLTPDHLVDVLESLLNDGERLSQMAAAAHAMGTPQAVANIADAVEDLRLSA